MVRVNRCTPSYRAGVPLFFLLLLLLILFWPRVYERDTKSCRCDRRRWASSVVLRGKFLKDKKNWAGAERGGVRLRPETGRKSRFSGSVPVYVPSDRCARRHSSFPQNLSFRTTLPTDDHIGARHTYCVRTRAANHYYYYYYNYYYTPIHQTDFNVMIIIFFFIINPLL